MKKLTFIRHSMPEDPYTDYTKLTFQQICDLATEKFTPNIHPDSDKLLTAKLNENEMKEVDVILCSNSKRTIQTAELIKKTFNLDVEIIQMDLLREIHFDPSQQMSLKEYEERGLPLIREKLFEGMEKGIGADSIKETMERIMKLDDDYLKGISFENILCITHSFYMRFLRIYFLEKIKKYSDITPKKLTDTIDHTYIEGFKMEFN